MKPYADAPTRRLRQILGDLLFVGWLVMWSLVGMAVHDGTLALAGPGRLTESSATSLATQLRDAGSKVSEAPLVGDELATPFEKAAEASDGIARAGRSSVDAVQSLAWWLGISIALIPTLIVVVFYLPLRWRFTREATAGARFIDSSADLDLFALRALSRQPLHVLAKVSDDPAGAWRRGDPEVVRRLAEIELADVGLRPKRLLAQT